MRKKYPATAKDKEDWAAFINQAGRVYNKDSDLEIQNTKLNKIRKLDLHGLSLEEANKMVKKFINESFEDGFKKLLIITGKGLRSKVHNNPYLSEHMSVLKYSVPEFIKNNENLFSKINRLSKADLKDGGDGAFYIFLKSKINL